MIEDIRVALQVLKKGGVILYPTDTIWGIGCDATNPEAVNKVYALKERNDAKSMLVLLDDVSGLERYLREVPAIAWDLVEMSDNPLTVIFPGAKNLAENIIAPDGTVGIRVVRDEFCRNLIRQFRKPIVSTSANISGKKWPENFDDIDPVILHRVDYTVKWRQEDHSRGKPSAIIKLGMKGEIEIIRK